MHASYYELSIFIIGTNNSQSEVVAMQVSKYPCQYICHIWYLLAARKIGRKVLSVLVSCFAPAARGYTRHKDTCATWYGDELELGLVTCTYRCIVRLTHRVVASLT
jgi:hypothetical protein